MDNIVVGVILSCIFLITFCESATILADGVTRSTSENEYPVIGVLSQEISYSLEQKYPGQFKSYIASSYVKFVEGGGARVVPIW
jgi:Peptidase C26